jgi:hypothetical protein
MSEKLSRKEAIREFKERKVARGVFAVRCSASGHVWVDSSPNLNAAENSLWFCLRIGSHINKALQAEWETHGKDAFRYEVLETLSDDVSPLALKDLLKEKRRHCLAESGGRPLTNA